MHLVLTLAYDGTGYCGFQRQRPGPRPAVQEVLERALGRALGVGVAVTAAGRTDAGVHAEAQVVAFRAETSIPVARLPYAVNRLLPPDVVVTGAWEAPAGFHPRFSAVGKVYRYALWRAPFPSPFWRRYAWHRPQPLDVPAMRQAAALLEGRRDFAAMMAAGRPVRDTVRTVVRCEVEDRFPLLLVRVEADGFLYKMVRTMVGTLVEVGRGRMAPAEVAAILASRDRRRAGPTAPPHGLCLEAVRYPPGVGPGGVDTSGGLIVN